MGAGPGAVGELTQRFLQWMVPAIQNSMKPFKVSRQTWQGGFRGQG